MKGKITVVVQNNRVQYKFTLNRNLTVLRGDSATGKTTLIEMIGEYEQDPQSGITLKCEKECRVVAGVHWREQLESISDSIVFIDEGNRFLKSLEFANAVKNSDNYYVLVTREPLKSLPYSVEEVYGIVNKTKGYGLIKRMYSSFRSLYPANALFYDFNLVIVEDSNSGFDFFSSVFGEYGISCICASGKANIANEILKTQKDDKILVIADGAAFGPEMEQVLRAGVLRKTQIYLPESFEWLILRSGLISDKEIEKTLESPSDFIESREYFSWENFFFHLLKSKTNGTYLEYKKDKLNSVYLREKEKNAITTLLPFQIGGE